MGHDGPANIGLAKGKPRLTYLDKHHGKSGHGLSIDFDMQEGPVTLINLTQFDSGATFKLIYTIGEIIPGPVLLRIRNPNARVPVSRPLPEFMDTWCQHGPSHHVALGLGDHSQALQTFAEAMGFPLVRV
jgi:L-arabinose isomerase